jgi:hypothetical protein
MYSLILIAITIVTVSALSVVAINYTPWWSANAQHAHERAADGLVRLERAYELATAAHPDEVPPVPTAEADGGLQSLMGTYYGFLPAAPQAMSWRYGVQASGPFQGLHYLCVQGAGVPEGSYRGLARLATTLGPGQAVLSDSCGGTAMAAPSSFPAPVALTYYMQYVPEV